MALLTYEKLFTIGIPNYNYEKYIKKTIDSILCQEGDDFEVLIADNQSTDKSWEIICSYNDERLKIFRHETNIGFHANWNFVLNNAIGKYFILLPSDDYLTSDFMATIRSGIKKHENVNIGTIVWQFGNFMQNEQLSQFPKFNKIKEEYGIRKINQFAFGCRHFTPPWAHAQLTKSLQYLGGYKKGSRRLDTLLFYNFFELNKESEILIIPKILAYQRVHESNERYSKFYEIFLDNIEIAQKILLFEINFFNRLKLWLFLTKNYWEMILFKKETLIKRNAVKLSFMSICLIFLLSPIVLFIVVTGKYLRFPPFSTVDNLIKI
jgi:glycosyltransferase involved in cell wall biosynthesis